MNGEGKCPTANNLPILAAELFIVWLSLLFASEDAAVLCRCSRANEGCTLGIFFKTTTSELAAKMAGASHSTSHAAILYDFACLNTFGRRDNLCK